MASSMALHMASTKTKSYTIFHLLECMYLTPFSVRLIAHKHFLQCPCTKEALKCTKDRAQNMQTTSTFFPLPWHNTILNLSLKSHSHSLPFSWVLQFNCTRRVENDFKSALAIVYAVNSQKRKCYYLFLCVITYLSVMFEC